MPYLDISSEVTRVAPSEGLWHDDGNIGALRWGCNGDRSCRHYIDEQEPKRGKVARMGGKIRYESNFFTRHFSHHFNRRGEKGKNIIPMLNKMLT